MRKFLSFRLTAVALILFGPSSDQAELRSASQRGNENVVAFVGTTVVPMMSEHLLADHTVIVRGDRIAIIGPRTTTPVPRGARRIDGRGTFLIPGLTDMHSHLPGPSESKEYLDSLLFLFLANGVTTVRGTLGLPGHLGLREQANRGAIVAPTLYLAGPSIDGDVDHSPADVERLVRRNRAEGWDFFKVLPGISPDDYRVLVRTAGEVGAAFGGHVPTKVGLPVVLEARQPIIDHLDGYLSYLSAYREALDNAKLADVAERTKKSGSAVVPTMAIWNNVNGNSDLSGLRNYPELKFMPARFIDEWSGLVKKTFQPDRKTPEPVPRMQQRIVKTLHDHGVTILFGTDSPHVFNVPGFSIHREMRLMREAGLTPFEILKSATKTPGDHFRDKDRFGTIEVDARADLVLLNGNPLDDLEHLSKRAGVMVRGRWLPESEIQRGLDDIARRSARQPPASSYRASVRQGPGGVSRNANRPITNRPGPQ